MATIKQIKVGTLPYDLSAKYLLDASGNEKSWKDVTDLVEAGFEIQIVTGDLPVIDKDNYATYKNKLLLKADATAAAGTYLEYVAYNNNGTYGLEQIGSTQVDLTNYQQTGKTLPTTEAGAGATGSAGGQTATGTASVTYKKADAATGSAGAHTHDVDAKGSYQPAGSVAYSGTTAASKATVISGVASNAVLNPATAVTVLTGVKGGTASGTISVNKGYTHTDPTFNTVSVVTGVTGGTASGTTVINTGYTHADPAFNSATVVTGVTAAGLASATVTSTGAVTYVESVTHTAASLTGTKTFVTGYANFSGGSLTGTKTFNTDAIKSVSGTKNYGFASSTNNVMTAPTVTDGVLSWTAVNAATQDAHTGDAASTGTVGFTAAALGTASTGTVGISGGEITPVTKYLKATGGTASGTTTALTGIKTAGGITSVGTATVVTGVTAASASGTTIVLQSVKAAGGITTTGAATVVTGVTAASANGTTSVVPSYTLTQMTFNTISANTDAIKGITGLGFTGTTATISVSGTAASAGAHTHSIGSSDATASGSASVAVSAHTHSIGNHTHSVTTKN